MAPDIFDEFNENYNRQLLRDAINGYLDEGKLHTLYQDLQAVLTEERDKRLTEASNYETFYQKLFHDQLGNDD